MSTSTFAPVATSQREHSGVGAWLSQLEALLDEAPCADATTIDRSVVADLVRRLGVAASRVAATRLAVLAVAEHAAVARGLGATSTAAWLIAEGATVGVARREVELATALADPAFDATRGQLASGELSTDQAQVITAATRALSEAVTETDRAAFQADLLEQAKRLHPGRLRDAARRAAARVDPTGSGDLERSERAWKARREVTLFKARDGMWTLAGSLDPLGAAKLAAALDPLAAPRASSVDGPDPRTAARRRADALVTLAEMALAGGGLPDSGGLSAQIVVTMTVDQLRGTEGGSATLVGGPVREPISVAAARREACDAGLLPAVLGGPSEILDLGRSRRLASPGQRRALALRDGGCTAPGCDRPPTWCEAHHLVGWTHSRGQPGGVRTWPT